MRDTLRRRQAEDDRWGRAAAVHIRSTCDGYDGAAWRTDAALTRTLKPWRITSPGLASAALSDADAAENSERHAASSPLSFSENMYNPYAAALEGLEFDDPVASFFDFCREREKVRQQRERGAEPPWSDDPIFQNARFLNVFREDDRGTKAILKFVGPLVEKGDLTALVHGLFFARWCNKQATLDALTPDLLLQPEKLKEVLESLPDQPWCNVAAYPVEPVSVDGVLYSRLDTATFLFPLLAPELTKAIAGAGGSVICGARAANAILGMENDFAVFMAVMDIAWFRPEVIDPASHVPTGIGAVAFLDILQRHLHLETHQQTSERMIALQAGRLLARGQASISAD
ncbi:hypothetical protein CYMTET_56765 [Cymbomonas tetramitiformis]|uniref:5-hmdU DNA kinase helical domain-containing protein n=1 Tax=Cymbomonas tetramitiformis TaxID=36881 RepID=A0AAE0BAM9_9CHLO|nr:hypothetical protein CYMTET_56765 [Cymbomonas tetramitiformis]